MALETYSYWPRVNLGNLVIFIPLDDGTMAKAPLGSAGGATPTFTGSPSAVSGPPINTGVPFIV
jgi:hypothetical protein